VGVGSRSCGDSVWALGRDGGGAGERRAGGQGGAAEVEPVPARGRFGGVEKQAG
jgi:hypothetical protein